MAFTTSNVRAESVGSLRSITGDFTSADGDSSFTLTHGMNYIASANVTLDAGGLNAQQPKIAHSAGVMTATFEDTQGYSGKFQVVGK